MTSPEQHQERYGTAGLSITLAFVWISSASTHLLPFPSFLTEDIKTFVETEFAYVIFHTFIYTGITSALLFLLFRNDSSHEK